VRHKSLIPLLVLAVPLAAHTATNEIPFEPCEKLLWVKANTQSGEVLNLLLDTGAAVSVLNTAAAERLALKPGRRVSVSGVQTSLTGYSLKPISLTAEGFLLPAPALAVDLQKFSSSCTQPVDGLLGADFFRSRIVQIDFEAHKLRILSSAPTLANAQTVPLQFRPCGMRVAITVNEGKSQWVRLDTGCASALQWVTSTVRARDCSRKTAIGLSELSIPQTETTVQIGSHEFQNVPTGIHEKPIFMGEAGLLGNDLLSRFSKITLDGKSRRLILEEAPRQ